MSHSTPSGGLWGLRTAGELWWASGHSGALSLQGWLQKHGIDGVVMRDGDVREQTAIQSGTSKRGLLGPIITSAYWAGLRRTDWGRDEWNKRGGLSKGVQTLHPTICLLFWCVTWASSPGLKRTYSMCPRKMLRSITSLHRALNIYVSC